MVVSGRESDWVKEENGRGFVTGGGWWLTVATSSEKTIGGHRRTQQ